jgi:hypothetical protein
MNTTPTQLAARVAGAVIVGLLLVCVAGWGALAAFDWRFHPTPSLVRVVPPADHRQAVLQDLEALGQLTRLDRSFSAEAVQRFDEQRAALMASAQELSPQALEMQVSRLVALAGNGHTTVGRRLRRLNRVPIRVAWFAEGLFVVRATGQLADLLGSQVVTINAKKPEDLLNALAPYLSGTPEHAKAISPLLLESPGALSGVWPDMSASAATYTLHDASGRVRTVTLDASSPDPKSAYVDPTRDLAPQRQANETEDWQGVLSGRTGLPPVLQDPDASVHVQSLDQGAGLYVHVAKVEEDERGAVSDQLAKLLRAIEPGSLRYAVLDLRFDSGGDYVETARFTKELPRRIADNGTLFILTDHATFSAALVTAARAKYFAGSRAVILGERVGDRERFWAESGAPLELPNSKITVFFATGYHDWNQGCQWKDLARCFWLNLAFDVPAGSLAPDTSISWRFADYRLGIDTVMEEVRRRANQLSHHALEPGSHANGPSARAMPSCGWEKVA